MSERSQYGGATIRDIEVITAPENQPVSLARLLKDLGISIPPTHTAQDQSQAQEQTQSAEKDAHAAELEQSLNALKEHVEALQKQVDEIHTHTSAPEEHRSRWGRRS